MSKDQMLSNVVEWSGDPDLDIYLFTWMLTDWCNYDCAYCVVKEIMRDKWDKDSSPSAYKLVLTRLEKFDGPFDIELFGGEPTLHPNMEEILLRLNAMDKCRTVNIVTNLSRPISYFSRLNDLKMDSLLINVSLHMEYYTPEFLEKVYQLSQMENITVGVIVNLSNKKDEWPIIIELIEQFVKWGCTPHLNFLRDMPFWKANYDEEFYNLFRPIQNKLVIQAKYTVGFKDGTVKEFGSLDMIKNGYNRFNGFECRSKFYNIDFDGNFTNSCTSNLVKPIIITKEKLDKTIVCPNNVCGCDPMLLEFKKRI
jgi:MoaA/NifB/PqqE/SkfB family radical SAM enzyme